MSFNPLTGEFGLSCCGKSSVVKSFEAGETISALRAVYQDIDKIYLAGSDQDHRPIGIATQSGASGAMINVVLFGELKDASFVWPANKTIYLSLNGFISDTPASSGFNIEIGYSQGAGEIFVNIKNQIVLI